MKGTIIGDIVGSRFEFNNHKSKFFDLFSNECKFTDDTICTIATMEWLSENEDNDYSMYLKKWCKKYPNAGFSPKFKEWFMNNGNPYNSFGNGSAMRVSPVGWYATFEGAVFTLSENSAEVSHNHSEGIKGANAIAYTIYLSKKGTDKKNIKSEIEQRFGYKLNQTVSFIRKYNEFDATCQITVPQAIICFLESVDFEDALRLAISIGGDSDTIGAMVGGIAEAFYGVPLGVWQKAKEFLPREMITIVKEFYSTCSTYNEDLAKKRFVLE